MRIRLNFPPHLIRALHFVWESGPKWTLASAALVLIQGLLPLLTLYLMKLLVDTLTLNLKRSRQNGSLSPYRLATRALRAGVFFQCRL